MTIYDVLKENGTRVSYENKWLIWDGFNWVVYERKPYAKKSIILYEGREESRAIWYLMSEELDKKTTKLIFKD